MKKPDQEYEPTHLFYRSLGMCGVARKRRVKRRKRAPSSHHVESFTIAGFLGQAHSTTFDANVFSFFFSGCCFMFPFFLLFPFFFPFLLCLFSFFLFHFYFSSIFKKIFFLFLFHISKNLNKL
jgi:hypothetical protein